MIGNSISSKDLRELLSGVKQYPKEFELAFEHTEEI